MSETGSSVVREPHATRGHRSPILRVIGIAISAWLLLAVVAGAWAGLTAPASGTAALVQGLTVAEVLFAVALILLGSIVEGFGWGLSLGTRWPYTRNIVTLLLRGDPEAAHRMLATMVGLIALALAILHPVESSFVGLGLVIVTALFGMGTLYVLAGRAPAVVHGTHGLLAYLVFLDYLVALHLPGVSFPIYLEATGALHAVLLALFLGGMVTGQRGFGKAIEAFVRPKGAAQWIFILHGLAALLVIGTLGWMEALYPVAFVLALVQAAVGFFVFHAVNLKPRHPGALVVFHQAMVLLITSAIVLQWRF
ncbi:MAG: COX15/CtaA family protein [Metallibacterium scheffleri]|jgi:hypothetical protein